MDTAWNVPFSTTLVAIIYWQVTTKNCKGTALVGSTSLFHVTWVGHHPKFLDQVIAHLTHSLEQAKRLILRKKKEQAKRSDRVLRLRECHHWWWSRRSPVASSILWTWRWRSLRSSRCSRLAFWIYYEFQLLLLLIKALRQALLIEDSYIISKKLSNKTQWIIVPDTIFFCNHSLPS